MNKTFIFMAAMAVTAGLGLNTVYAQAQPVKAQAISATQAATPAVKLETPVANVKAETPVAKTDVPAAKAETPAAKSETPVANVKAGTPAMKVEAKSCTKIPCSSAIDQNKSKVECQRSFSCDKMSKEEIKSKMEAKKKEFNELLGLSEEQILKTKEMKMAARAQMKPIVTEMKLKHEQIGEIMNNSKLSAKARDKKIAAIKKDLMPIETKMMQLRQDSEKEFVSILTVEQKAKYDQIKKDAKDCDDEHFGARHNEDHKDHPEDHKNPEHANHDNHMPASVEK